MILCMEDRRENLERMHERGCQCLETAKAIGDQNGVAVWQRSLSAIESLISKAQATHSLQ